MNERGAGAHLDRVARYLARRGLAGPGTTISELSGDASDRRYVRLRLADGTTRMLMVHSGPIDSRTLPFPTVARLLARMQVPAPAVLDGADDLGILLLDDLGDVTLLALLEAPDDARRDALYREAVDLIVRMQQRGRELASPAELPFTLAFDEAKLTWELDFFVQHFLTGLRRARLSAAARAALGDELHAVARELAAEPRVFCHRDYHSRNLMVCGGRLYVIDFQDARMGPDTYDLVSLLRDCYVRHEPAFVSRMIAYYHDRLGTSAGPAYHDRFDLMSVQRHLKALGTFGHQAAVVGNDRYLSAIPRTAGYLAEVFGRQARFARLRELLAASAPDFAG
ncbi:MAG: phosphotransferase [Acidobacteria bacterium]|nr:phosphotransferase [Acidobacteriota bacterium]